MLIRKRIKGGEQARTVLGSVNAWRSRREISFY